MNCLILLFICILIIKIYANPVWETIDENEPPEDCGCGSNLNRGSADPSAIVGISEILVDSVRENRKLSSKGDNMVFIKGGRSVVGTDNPQIWRDGESPKRVITLDSFFIDKFEVSNEDFANFVEETGFVTESEKFGWSFVFHTAIPKYILDKIEQAVLGAEWWLPVNGSYWKEPEGPGTDVFQTNRSRFAVSQVSWNDAVAYCKWKGARLPTEAEWETAARGPNANGEKDEFIFPWGNKLFPNSTHRANVFQGNFPVRNSIKDGYEFISPVDAFGPQNDYGVYNMIGNVWEWVEDWHTIDHDLTDLMNPKGPASGTDKVKKGGSFLCHKSYCYRYRSVARFPSTPDSATLNIGFRCARTATKEEIAAGGIITSSGEHSEL